ncbi:hypothetical protein F4778DRAFT_793935 [Xylariomycetidae sp. FL2044]|nr:hypothetical protein F4778DRAFT_793935 [Xylariomycetidae sp. FL2044]
MSFEMRAKPVARLAVLVIATTLAEAVITRSQFINDRDALADSAPIPSADGSCAVYTVAAGDLCEAIEDKYNLGATDLDKFNVGKTWGWAGCRRIQPGQRICVSDGDPPMPSYDTGAICGPQVPGTERPENGTKISELNKCPLNVCCNIWGQCGIDEDFCIDTSIDNTPGTAEIGTYGCISNCGMDIVNNKEPPSEFSRVAYFEAWNRERPCLHMDVTDIGTPHTHIHFAFGYITDDYVPSAKGSESQFQRFVKIRDLKRVISFGGWAFSNDPATSHIIRDGVKPANRQKFADNIVQFVEDNNLDGVDFDWEYPGADDIPGADPGTPEDGPNYLEFLKLVRKGLGDDKVLAIAAPASYWYLKNFPIAEISEVVSYIVYMTYDLHGQWDVNNKFISPGCPEGNCLRSHVNSTITHNALSMITKAGVKANKVMVGIVSYGRSFKMAEVGCEGPSCHYLGGRNQSPAMPGECTETAGYIADAEIRKIKADGKYPVEQYWDSASDSDIFIYNDVEWIGWMAPETKRRRVSRYAELNFAGASDWAVDLQGDIDPDDGETVYIGSEVYEDPEMHCEASCTIVLAPSPLSETTTITIPPYTTSLQVGTTTVTVTVTPSPITTDEVEFYNIPIPTMSGGTTVIQPYPSIPVPDAEVPVTFESDGEVVTTTRTIAMPPWPAITNGPAEDWNGTAIPSNTGRPTYTVAPGPPPSPLPTITWTDWNEIPAVVTPVPDKISKPTPVNQDDDEDDIGPPAVLVPCDLWFFDSCNSDIDIGGWKWILPPGILPPGPPPPGIIKPGKDWQIDGPLPPWPPISVGSDGVPTDIPDKPSACETESASMCGTTMSYGVGAGGSTTTTAVVSTCHTIYGCHLTDWEETSTTTGATCYPTNVVAARTLPATNQAAATVTASTSDTGSEERAPPTGIPRAHLLVSRADEDDKASWADDKAIARDWDCQRSDVVIYCENPWSCDTLSERMEGIASEIKVTRIATASSDFTAFFHVEGLPSVLFERIREMSECGHIYDPIAFGRRFETEDSNEPEDTTNQPRAVFGGKTEVEDSRNNSTLRRRQDGDDQEFYQLSDDWANSQISTPPTVSDWATSDLFTENGQHKYWRYQDAGDGGMVGSDQFVYLVENCIDFDHPEFSEISKIQLNPPDPQAYGPAGSDNCLHGRQMAASIVGKTLGIVPGANLIPVETRIGPPGSQIRERYLEALVRIIDDARAHPETQGRAVINMSFAVESARVAGYFGKVMAYLLFILKDLNIAAVTGSGNNGDLGSYTDLHYPAQFIKISTLSDYLIVVGASNPEGRRPEWSEYIETDVNMRKLSHAPGELVTVPDGGGAYQEVDGTSVSAAKVSGLVAYLRALPSPWQEQLQEPARIKTLIRLFERPLPLDGTPEAERVPFVWNGHVLENHCLFDTNLALCPEIPEDLVPGSCGLFSSSPSSILARDCLPGGGGTAGGGGELGGLPVPRPITWEDGEAGPLCTENCGTACDGYFCDPEPTGTPPDHDDPNPPGDGDGGGDGGGDDGGEPSPFNYEIVWSNQDCTVDDTSEAGMEASNCRLPQLSGTGAVAASVRGFTKGDLRACFYSSGDCTAASSSDFVMIQGGDRLEGTDCVSIPGQAIYSFEISEQPCAGDDSTINGARGRGRRRIGRGGVL